jgi:hypothetical protein
LLFSFTHVSTRLAPLRRPQLIFSEEFLLTGGDGKRASAIYAIVKLVSRSNFSGLADLEVFAVNPPKRILQVLNNLRSFPRLARIIDNNLYVTHNASSYSKLSFT